MLKFCNIGPRGQCYKTIVCDLQIFVLSVCQTRPEKLTNDKRSSLLWESVIYGQKSFIESVPGRKVKFFFVKKDNNKRFEKYVLPLGLWWPEEIQIGGQFKLENVPTTLNERIRICFNSDTLNASLTLIYPDQCWI